MPGTHQTISGYVQQIRLCHKNTTSCLYLQPLQQHYRGSHVCGVNMEDDALFSSPSRRLPHRRAGANAHRIVKLGQTCIISAFHLLPRCRTVLRCVHRQQSMRQRAYHHVRSNGRRSPSEYARRTGCSSWGVIAAARVNTSKNRVFPQKLR